jgi:selenocysteine-specific elongation factor
VSRLQRSIIIGTAGHIDHGKTTLVRALTGIDTDRLPEEKRRGITIDLGFASFVMQAPDDSPLRISFVDVPGHSLFIRNMLAGAGCVPAVMFVVAADEGIMPQTIEHLAICELLGILHGMTVITKSDAVDADQLQAVTESVEKFLRGTFLDKQRALILPVSAVTGRGLDSVRDGLLDLGLRVQLEADGAVLRMPLDRSFVMKGFGTVVTGTLLSGNIHEGNTLQLEPKGCAVRVRGLQIHGQPVQSVQPGSRVAVNLSGISATEIHRGQTLVSPHVLSPVDTIDAEVILLANAAALKHRASVHFHGFTSETMARISLYGYEAAQPGSSRLMRIKLAEPIVLIPGDRFVLRQPSPAGTVGGGRILDAHPEPRQRKGATVSWLERLKKAPVAEQVNLRVNRRHSRGIAIDVLSSETGLTPDAIHRHIRPALDSGDLVLLPGDLLLSREALHAGVDSIINRLQGGRPIRPSVLRSQAALGTEVFEFLIDVLVRERKVLLAGDMITLPGFATDATSTETETLGAVERIFAQAGLVAPSVLEVAQRLDISEADMRRIITILQRSQAIVRMGNDNLFIHSTALARLTAQIAALRGTLMDVGRFKQLTGLSRKYAIPLLEYLDRQRITRVQGEQRLIL